MVVIKGLWYESSIEKKIVSKQCYSMAVAGECYLGLSLLIHSWEK